MSKAENDRVSDWSVKKYAIFLAAGWTLLIAIISVVTAYEKMNDVRELVKNEAQAHFLKDEAFRNWASGHGGVYVPPTDHTPPNPNLAHLPYRDVVTIDGMKLTLMNPAYMVRQLMEGYEEHYGVKGRITSLKPLRAKNAPDEWEREALESFERGNVEAKEFSDIEGKSYLRLMRPMTVKEPCLKCHGHQGYKVGDVQGGAGVSVPTEGYYEAAYDELFEHALGLGIIWLAGLGILLFGFQRIQKGVQMQREAENSLRESEEKYKALFDRDSDAIFVFDPKTTKIIEANTATSRLYGFSREELIGRSCKDFSHDLKVTNAAIKKIKNEGSSHVPLSYHRKKDGTIFPTEISSSVIMLDGKMAMFAVSKDITARMKAEEKAKQLVGFAMNNPAPVLRTDWAGKITLANPASKILFKRDVEGEPIQRLLPILVGWFKTNSQSSLAMQVEQKLGDETYLFSIQRDEATQAAYIYGIDITETKRLKDQESKAARLEAAGIIAGQVAHDFNNLLAPLMAYPEFIREELPADHSALTYLDEIELSAARIAELNQDLLTMGRRGHFNQQKIDLNQIILQTIKESNYNPKSASFKIELAEQLLPISGGNAQISRMIANLVTNAQDAVGENGQIIIRTENYITTNENITTYGHIPKGEYVKLTISDNGCGIPEDIVQEILVPFFTTKGMDKQRGSGLGLSVVNSVVRDHNGYLDLKSKVDLGTSFFIYFPVCKESAQKPDAAPLVSAVEI